MDSWVNRERLCQRDKHGHFIREWGLPCHAERQDGDLDLSEFTWWGWDHHWNKHLRAPDLDSSDNPRTLGLHWSRGAIRTSHFIGAVRLGEGEGASPLIIESKIPGLDAASVFAEVLAAPKSITGVEFDLLFGCDTEQEPIDAVDLPGLTLLEVIAYLHSLAHFVQRHLRQGFVRVQENLIGKVRGRVLISRHVRENLARARPDRVICEFTVFSLDTLENRILKAALDIAGHWLTQAALAPDLQDALHRWSAIARTALATVPDCRVNPRDWSAVHKTGLMAAYARPLALARMILARLHLTPNGRVNDDPGRTFPFFLNANRLFEAWVGVCLHAAGCPVRAQVARRLNVCEGGAVEFRPDFVLGPDPWAVVDAKYKILGADRLISADLFQAIGYTRLLTPHLADQEHVHAFREAWLAIPDSQGEDPLSVEQAKQLFCARWINRDGIRWPDEYRLGCVKVPLPRL